MSDLCYTIKMKGPANPTDLPSIKSAVVGVFACSTGTNWEIKLADRVRPVT